LHDPGIYPATQRFASAAPRRAPDQRRWDAEQSAQRDDLLSRGLAIGAAAKRGVFTRTAGLWRSQVAAAVPLPARNLLWLAAATSGARTFIAERDDMLAPALWLDYAPAVHDASLHDSETRVDA
jgi:hypothetical protein